jgi:hypothetical protein
MSNIVVDTYFGRFFFCKKCGRWTWHDRVLRIGKKDVWDQRLFACAVCKTVVDWYGKEAEEVTKE